MINNKKAVSPLVATVLLIVFSLILGTVTMNLGKAYIEGITDLEPTKTSPEERMVQQIGDAIYECIHFDSIQKKCIQWELVSE